MEDQRSSRSLPAQAGGPFYVHEEEARVSSIAKTAGVSVIGLVLVVGWMTLSHSGVQYQRPASAVAAVASDTDAASDLSSIAASANMEVTASDLKMIGPSVVGALVAQYETLKENNAYTPESAASVAEELGAAVVAPVPFKKYSASDVRTSSDNSYAAMLAYREKLKNALAPMASQKEYELGVFAKYSESKDPTYLEEVRSVVATYQNSITAAASITAPRDAASLHANTLNAMGQFAAVLEGLADNADDPITVMVLLRTYNEAESYMVSSFNNLAMYFAHHSNT